MASNDECYESHQWVGKRQYIPGEPDEWFKYCSVCGHEYLGDPAEFPEITYEMCEGTEA